MNDDRHLDLDLDRYITQLEWELDELERSETAYRVQRKRQAVKDTTRGLNE